MARNRTTGTRLLAVLGLVAALAVLLAACGDDEDGADAGDDVDAAEGDAVESIEALYEEIEGLEGEERTQRLEELAANEDGVTWYTSISDEEDLAAAFEEAHDIPVTIFRATIDEVRERVLEEESAGRPESDVIGMNDSAIYPLDAEGIFAPLETPHRDDLVEGHAHDNWIWGVQNTFVAAWNTDVVDGNPPQTWEELLTEYGDMLAFEPRNHVLVGTLVEDYFVEQHGMSEEEAIDLYREAAQGARAIQGNPTLAEMLTAGEFGVTTTYVHYFPPRIEAGAPVAYEPPVEPVVTAGNGLGIHRETSNPASALLFVEWFVTGGQEVLEDLGWWPSNEQYMSEDLLGYETIEMREEIVLDEDGKWAEIYGEIMQIVGDIED